MYYVQMPNLVLGTRNKTMKSAGKALETHCSREDNKQVNKS